MVYHGCSYNLFGFGTEVLAECLGMFLDPFMWKELQEFLRRSFLHIGQSGDNVVQIKPRINVMIPGGIEQGQYHANVPGRFMVSENEE